MKLNKKLYAIFKMKINTKEEHGKQGVKGLIELTKEQKVKPKNSIIKMLEEQGVFRE